MVGVGMLENRTKCIVLGSEGPGEYTWVRKPLIEKIMKDSRGWIDLIVMTVNGMRIVFTGGDGVEPKHIAEAASSIAKATLVVMELFGSKNFNEIDLQVQESRHLIIRGYRGCYIAALTKPNPNLGLVKLALNKNLAPDRLLRKVMHATRERLPPDARILEEKPATRNTRIPEYLIVEMFAGGMSVEKILEEHPELSEKEIKAALEHAASLLKMKHYCEIPSK